jgi:hypothetical protein
VSARRLRRQPKTPKTRSVVKAEYRERYNDGSCGDDLAQRLRQHTAGADGVDVAKLRALAEANDVWDDRYANLNAGLQRMTIGNKLRALVRHGSKVKWGRA